MSAHNRHGSGASIIDIVLRVEGYAFWEVGPIGSPQTGAVQLGIVTNGIGIIRTDRIKSVVARRTRWGKGLGRWFCGWASHLCQFRDISFGGVGQGTAAADEVAMSTTDVS